MKVLNAVILITLSVCCSIAGTITHTGDFYVSGFYEEPVVIGDNAFIASVYGLVALDVDNPENMYPLSHEAGQGYAYSLESTDNLIYLTNWQDELLVINVANPLSPEIIFQLDLPGEVWSIDFAESIAAVACGPEGVCLLDISNPEIPAISGSFGINGFAVDVVVVNDQVITAGWDTGVFSTDITDPTDPESIDSYTSNPGIVRGIAYSNGFLYLAEEGYGLEVLYIDAAGNFDQVGASSTTFDYFNLKTFGNRLYVCAGLDGLKIYDITIPTIPIPLYSINTDGEVWGTFIQEQTLFVADGPGGLISFHTNYGNEPIELGHYQPFGNIIGIASSDNVVYAAALQDDIQVFEVVDSALEWRGYAQTPDSARSITLKDELAITACGASGLALYDLNIAYAPILLDTVDTPGYALRTLIDSDTAWVADGAMGIAVIDVTDPQVPEYITNVITVNEALSLAKDGDLLFVAEGNNGVTIYDIANLNIPTIIGNVIPADTASAYDVAVVDQYALIAASEAGLRIIDIADPVNALEVAHLDLPGHAERIIVAGSMAFVALHDQGIAVVDISNPESPILSAWAETPGSAVDMALMDDKIILADTYCLGLYESDLTTGLQTDNTLHLVEEFELETPYPNPFNPATSITFTLPYRTIVDLDVYNVGGQQVAELVNAELTAGKHSFKFNAANLPSGLYFARLKTKTYTATEKMVLLK
ncbi:hypothetical protein CEE37_14500 [candidate division LCP-89 bacterium B3_LCP]|uniref:Secretion system C-terminal sorting domain-containing protein n=1 Tax=candidate division LCP-89 bacterium B3_LCP TaxID=2012998 RepID=A0A532UPR2_UNCL8|nr:MAG: hypothetical protein CEE37_14500 [candidate division LCP-89 bacterium B3_LCP]